MQVTLSLILREIVSYVTSSRSDNPEAARSLGTAIGFAVGLLAMMIGGKVSVMHGVQRSWLLGIRARGAVSPAYAAETARADSCSSRI